MIYEYIVYNSNPKKRYDIYRCIIKIYKTDIYLYSNWAGGIRT